MGLIKYGMGIAQISGKIGGSVYARNSGGNYVRNWVKPVNPNTALQQAVRNIMGQLTTRWNNTLTAAQRTAWNLYGASVAMTNRLGETVYLSGINHYIRSNLPRIQAGATTIDDGPTTFALPEMDATFAVSISAATQNFSVVFDTGLDWVDLDDAHLITWAGQPQNPSRNFFAGPWNFMDTIDGDSGTPPTSPATQASPFVATEGQRIWVAARISLDDGRLSQRFEANCFCAA